ncbi:nuclear transport factor 2 family protein [Sphingobium sp. CFD-1]|uniref:YybH family protein n=1 Tax=Sphingobium sp. CFD-1 TaxID=2878545 RepID=UPI00214AEE6D|nr:nuclear transport factor 2 family protein [Sphingobium sp. CFD-1]
MVHWSNGCCRLVRISIMSLSLVTAGQPSIAAAGSAKSVWNRPADIKAIRALESRLANSANAEDLSGLLADNVVLLDAYAPSVRRGRQEVIDAYRGHRDVLRSGQGRYTEMSVVSTPNFACSASQIRYDVKDQAGGGAKEFRKLDVFKKIGGRWQLIQQHISVALDRQTYTATVNPLPVRGALTWQDAKFSNVPVDVESARRGIVDWTEQALREVGLHSAMKFIAPGQDVLVYGEFNPGNLRTREEVTAYWGPLYNSFSGLEVQSPVFEVDSDGLLGAQIDTQNITIAMKDGTRPRISIRQSDCLRQFDGKWQTFLEAVSYTVNRETGQAIVFAP